MVKKLKAEYPNEPAAPYKVLNSLGAMLGNKETPRGRAMQAKHDAKMGRAAVPSTAVAVPIPSRPVASAQQPHANLGKWLHPKKSR